jgi:hypothetical protein
MSHNYGGEKALRDLVKKDGMENRVVLFEQPDEDTVRRARATGNFWNTLVCAAKLKNCGPGLDGCS